MAKTFVQTISDVLRQNTILSGDDADIVTFTDVQHKATILLAKTAVQSTLNQLVADRLLPFERTDGTIVFINNQRIYSLPADFIRFADSKPYMLQLDALGVSENRYLYEYPGGLGSLGAQIPQYREQQGTPWSWYYSDSTTEQVGFYQFPDTTAAGTQVRFSYEKEVMVNVEADTLPLSRVSMEIAFTDMASRWFRIINSGKDVGLIGRDPAYMAAKSTLIELLRFKNPVGRYGYKYQ